MALPNGVVLDFDGVLVDSMPAHAKAYREVLSPFGITVEDRTVFLLEGARSESILREFLRRAGQAADAQTVEELSAKKQRAFASGPRPRLYPGAMSLFEAVRAAASRVAVVTGTRRENVERFAPDVVARADAILTQEDYGRDKPDPEPYQAASRKIGVDPALLVAIENAPRGIESARAAGFGFVVAITTTLSREDLLAAGPHVVVATHEEAASAVLGRLRGRAA